MVSLDSNNGPKCVTQRNSYMLIYAFNALVLELQHQLKKQIGTHMFLCD
jgi:hypothetical protein